jgi:hypothetical protein
MAYFEAERVATARHAVVRNWASGLAVGIAASLVLTALLAAAIRSSQRRPEKALGRVALLTTVITLSVLLAYAATYVREEATTAVAVAAMTYAGTFSLLVVVLLLWTFARIARRRLGAPGGAA